MLIQIMDQRWREHLVEMDYLNEGIHLRGIAQTDPLVAWQREGFEMFGKLMDSIDDDYLRYVMHVQVLAAPAEDPDYAQAAFVAADDPAAGLGELAQVPGCRARRRPTRRSRRSPRAPVPRRRRHRRPVPDSSRRPGRFRAPVRRAVPGTAARRTGVAMAVAGAGQRRPPAGPISPTGTRIVERAAGQGRAQRAVLVRQRPQVQGLPRRELNDRDSSIRRRPRRRAP